MQTVTPRLILNSLGILDLFGVLFSRNLNRSDQIKIKSSSNISKYILIMNNNNLKPKTDSETFGKNSFSFGSRFDTV